jgi:hypothetical protein
MTIDYATPWAVAYWHPDYAEQARQELHAHGRWTNLEIRKLTDRARWYLVPASGVQQPGW